MMSENIKIVVATHKKYRMPEDSIYLPVQVGAQNAEPVGFTPDNTGENISAKNANYCELTGLYWLWKNAMTDVVGLNHYRRFFARKHFGDKWQRIATEKEIRKALKKAPIILPKPRNYLVETNYTQYAHAHHIIDLETIRQIISEQCPQYLPAFDSRMKMTIGHRFNMFVMRRKYAEEYCEWLFPILFELEKRLDISSYSPVDQRVFGFASERLIDVWLDANGYKYVEMPVVFMEDVNWWVKGTNFLKRKYAAEHPKKGK